MLIPFPLFSIERHSLSLLVFFEELADELRLFRIFTARLEDIFNNDDLETRSYLS